MAEQEIRYARIQVRRGLEKNIPRLAEGEPAFTTDSRKVIMGSSTGNVELAKNEDIVKLNTEVENLKSSPPSNPAIQGVNVKQFGAKGDGVTDDTKAIQSAIDFIAAEVKKQKSYYTPTQLVFPTGNYKIKGIVSRPYIRIKSVDGVVALSYVGAPNGAALKIESEGGDPWSYKELAYQGKLIDGSSGVIFIRNLNTVNHNYPEGSVGLQIGNDVSGKGQFARYNVSDMIITGFESGLLLNPNDNFLGNFYRIHMEENKYNLVWGKADTQWSANSGENFHFTDCILSGGEAAIRLRTDTADMTFTGCSLNFNDYVVLITGGRGYTNVKMTDCYVESNYKELVLNTVDPSVMGWYQNPNFYINSLSQLLMPKTHLLFRGHMNVFLNGHEMRIGDPIEDADRLAMFDIKGTKRVRDVHSNTGYSMIESYDNSINTNSYDHYPVSADAALLEVPFLQIGKYSMEHREIASMKVTDEVLFRGKKTLKIVPKVPRENGVQVGFPLSHAIKAQPGERYIAKCLMALDSTTDVGFQWQFLAFDEHGNQLTAQTEGARWSLGLKADTSKKFKVVGTPKSIVCPAGTAYLDLVVYFGGISGAAYLADFHIEKDREYYGAIPQPELPLREIAKLPSSVPVVSDNFDREDRNYLGTADSGHEWSLVSGALGIKNGKAIGLNGNSNLAKVSTRYTNLIMSADVYLAVRESMWFEFRSKEQDNTSITVLLDWYGAIYVYRHTGWDREQLLQKFVRIEPGRELKVLLNGSKLQIYYGGFFEAEVQVDYNIGETTHGFGISSNGHSYIDNFKIEGLGTPEPEPVVDPVTKLVVPDNTIIVSDEFTRADGNVLGTANTGQTWQLVEGSVGIKDNKSAGLSSTGEDRSFLDSGQSNVVVSADITMNNFKSTWLELRTTGEGTTNGFVVELDRYPDVTTINVFVHTGWESIELMRKPVKYVAGRTLTVVLNGNTIQIGYGGVLIGEFINSHNINVTKHGIGFASSNGENFVDNFKVGSIVNPLPEKKSGDVVKLGTLYMGNTKVARPTKPWRTDSEPYAGATLGNTQAFTVGATLEIRNTEANDADKMQWVRVIENGKEYLVCDRNMLASITWGDLNAQNLLFGKEVTIDGNKYRLRVLTGGSNFRSGTITWNGGAPADNEWDKWITNEAVITGLPTPSTTDLDSTTNATDKNGAHNLLWNWFGQSSIVQEIHGTEGSVNRPNRGNYSARTYNHAHVGTRAASIAWRPVLEVL